MTAIPVIFDHFPTHIGFYWIVPKTFNFTIVYYHLVLPQLAQILDRSFNVLALCHAGHKLL